MSLGCNQCVIRTYDDQVSSKHKKCHRGQVTGGGSPNTGNNQIKDSTMDNGGN